LALTLHEVTGSGARGCIAPKGRASTARAIAARGRLALDLRESDTGCLMRPRGGGRGD